jgi:hypothetical protein
VRRFTPKGGWGHYLRRIVTKAKPTIHIGNSGGLFPRESEV